MQLTHHSHVRATVEQVRTFLLAGAAEEDVTLDGDVVEVRQHDRHLLLTVRNTVREHPEGGTDLVVDADLRLRGLAIVVGAVFHRRLRRTLGRSLEALPRAIEVDAGNKEAGNKEVPARHSGHAPPAHTEVMSMAEQERPEQPERTEAEAHTLLESSQDEGLEADKRVPEGWLEMGDKHLQEAAAAEGPLDAVKRVTRELDRSVSGEYEAREDEGAAPDSEDSRG